MNSSVESSIESKTWERAKARDKAKEKAKEKVPEAMIGKMEPLVVWTAAETVKQNSFQNFL